MQTIRESHSHSVQIMWDDPSLSQSIDNMFTPWRVNIPKSNTFDCIHVKSGKNSWRVYSDKCNYTVFSIEEAVYRIENAITLHFQDLLSQFLQIHAACIDYNGKGVVICGDHGAGKSTLALTALSSNMKVLSDDIVIVNDNIRDLQAFPRPIKAKGNTIHMEPSIVPEICPSFSVNQDFHYIFYYIPPDMFYSDATSLQFVVFPQRAESELVIREIGEVETLNHLLYQGFNYVKKKNSFLDILIGIIRNSKSYEITYRNSWDLVEALRDMLK